MNKENPVNFISSIIVFFILLFVYSKFGPAIPLSFTTQSKGEPLVVSAEGKSVVVPDVAKVTLGIEETGASLKSAQDSVNTKSKALSDYLKKMGVDEKDIKTVSYNVYPNYDYQSSDRKITGYRVSSSYEVKVKDIDSLNNILSGSTSLGVNTVGNVTFEVGDDAKKEKLQEAREEAVKEAKEKAKGLASASGITLGKIINVEETQDEGTPRIIPLLEKTSLDSGETPAPANIEAGQTEIKVTVSLSYEVR